LAIRTIVFEYTTIVDVRLQSLRVKNPIQRVLFRSAVCAALVGSVVYVYHTFHVNHTSVALTLLLSVLIISALWGLLYATLVAVAATALFNYFFLPPTGTFTIADTQNWVALFVFLITAVIASQLSDRARKQKDEAVSRRLELERLYNFSQQLLSAENVLSLLNAIPEFVVDSFGVSAAAIFIPDKNNIYRAGSDAGGLEIQQMQLVAMRGDPVIDSAHNARLVPLRMGVRTVGSMGIAGTLSSQTMNAVGSLIAIAIERANAVESLSRSEATRESEKLRSAILDSITHEFRTPLTSIKASITSLMSPMDLSVDDRRDLMSVIDEEADRLNRLVGEAAEMARLESHEFQLNICPTSILAVTNEAVSSSKKTTGKHPVDIRIDPELQIDIDAERIKEVIVQLLENAAKYSPPEAPIRITAEFKGNSLEVSVADQGVGIEDMEQNLIFEKFYRGKNERYRIQGTGMGLAIARAIVEAHGGRIGVTSQLQRGSVFYFHLPRTRT
jgi:two-component system sensor histidine kinase KdpD